VARALNHEEICRRYHVAWAGELDKVREKFYAISVERRISHPAVRLIADQAKRRLFT
jgi:LysR family transcriptional activator of nhaA